MNEHVFGNPILTIKLTAEIIAQNPALQADDEGPAKQPGQILIVSDNGTWRVV